MYSLLRHARGRRAPQPPAPTVRAFHPADAPRLADVWARAYAGFAGPVSLTPERWRWRVLERPGVDVADVPVVVDVAGLPVGYGVIDASGAVLEVAVDPGPHADAAAARVVEALEARCRARGLDAIRFVLPDVDDAVQRALRGAGYWTEPLGSFTATVADVAALLEAILPARLAVLRGGAGGAVPAGWGPTFRLEVERGADWPYPRLAARVALGPPLVVEAAPADVAAAAADADCTITLPLETLNRVFFDVESVDAALASGAITVRPTARAGDAAAFLRLITAGAPWYTPLADAR